MVHSNNAMILLQFMINAFWSLILQNKEVEDELYKKVEVEVRGHDPEVLKSYETYVKIAAEELGVNMPNV